MRIVVGELGNTIINHLIHQSAPQPFQIEACFLARGVTFAGATTLICSPSLDERFVCVCVLYRFNLSRICLRPENGLC